MRLLAIIFLFTFFTTPNISLAKLNDSTHHQQNIFVCKNCKVENTTSNKFCSECGAAKDANNLQKINVEETFKFTHNVGRVFSIPHATVLNSLDIGILLGGSYAANQDEGLLGTMSLGLGGFADIEISTMSLLGSILSRAENFSMVGLKIAVLNQTEKRPAVSVGFRSNNSWNRSVNTDISTHQPELGNYGLYHNEYDTRLTSLYLVVSKQMNPISNVHIGAGVSDIRYKNVYSSFQFPINREYENIGETKKNILLLFGGFDLIINERTLFMFEAQTIPHFNIDPKVGSINPKNFISSAAGIRFFISRWLVLDSGVRYQDNYKGLADAEIKISLNGFLNLKLK